jgi:hypothetical protein
MQNIKKKIAGKAANFTKRKSKQKNEKTWKNTLEKIPEKVCKAKNLSVESL